MPTSFSNGPTFTRSFSRAVAAVDGFTVLGMKATVATSTTVANLSAVTLAGLGGGYTPVEGETVLVIGSASPDGVVVASAAYKGLYAVGAVTTGVAALTRSTLYDTAAKIAGAMWHVEKGTHSGDLYKCPMRPGEITLNATLLTINVFTGGSGTGDLLADGTVPMTADWDFGGYALSDVGGVEIGTTTADTSSIAFAANPNGSGRATITVAAETTTGNYGTDLFIQSGRGPAATVSAIGYPGGGLYLLANDGGVGSATRASGWGGIAQVAGGNAGAANGGVGQSGGDVSLVGGQGTGTAGNGGNVLLYPGSASNIITGYRGYVYLDSGSEGLTNAAGDVRIGTTLASSIYVGHALATSVGITASTVSTTATTVNTTATTVNTNATAINLTATNTTVTGKLLITEVSGVIAGAAGDIIYRGATLYKNLPIGAVPGAALIVNPGANAPVWSTEVFTTLAAVRADNVLTVTVPVSYPYTTLSTDTHIRVDTTSPRSIVLHDGVTSIVIVFEDGNDLAASNNITFSLANSSKKLNGVINGTFVLAVSSASRTMARDTNSNWRGGV